MWVRECLTPGHALYCLWRLAERKMAAYQGLVSDMEVPLYGRRQTKAIPPQERTAGRPAMNNLCPVFTIHQIRALAAGQVSSAIHTEEETRAARTALVSNIFAALCTAKTK